MKTMSVMICRFYTLNNSSWGRASERQPRHLGRVFETNFWPNKAEIWRSKSINLQLAGKRMSKFRIDQLPKKASEVCQRFLEIQLSIKDARISCKMLKR